METPEPSAAELTESVIRVGAGAGYRIERDTAGRLQITAVDDEHMKHSLTFAVTGQELRAYYLRLAATPENPRARAHRGRPEYGCVGPSRWSGARGRSRDRDA